MIYGAGVDVGSTQTKAVILSEDRRIVGRSLIDTGANVSKAAERAFVKALEDAGLPREAVGYVVGTGYGRYKVTFGDAQVTEITCHARGAQYLYPATRTVIDMGGQDTKAIKVGPDGSVLDFSMNDKFAAGTGPSRAGRAPDEVAGPPRRRRARGHVPRRRLAEHRHGARARGRAQDADQREPGRTLHGRDRRRVVRAGALDGCRRGDAGRLGRGAVGAWTQGRAGWGEGPRGRGRATARGPAPS